MCRLWAGLPSSQVSPLTSQPGSAPGPGEGSPVEVVALALNGEFQGVLSAAGDARAGPGRQCSGKASPRRSRPSTARAWPVLQPGGSRSTASLGGGVRAWAAASSSGPGAEPPVPTHLGELQGGLSGRRRQPRGRQDWEGKGPPTLFLPLRGTGRPWVLEEKAPWLPPEPKRQDW